ncbi:MAG: F0F1 ATP synthase subunit epsilon [Candidatus Reconcilbacillus cellulovorans]|uniref:ATP synthase epsilon chain n=1 Tax=Candidatus Reconcilbacillus cellulovorans TaxID=1906605 RepID=A0A2A6E059_9BACL|nr:MAG: F0F1 ATP synthase subunit epsilon [Candidatus Reconcilbacillus cellulovorans]
MKTFLLEIVTPERVVFSEQVEMIVAEGAEGQLGVLANHVPLVTPLKIAPLKIRKNGKASYLAVNGGFLEVRKNKAVVLAESAEWPEEIDVERAMAAKARAEQRLKSGRRDEFDYRRAELALQRALNRLQVARMRGENQGEP